MDFYHPAIQKALTQELLNEADETTLQKFEAMAHRLEHLKPTTEHLRRILYALLQEQEDRTLNSFPPLTMIAEPYICIKGPQAGTITWDHIEGECPETMQPYADFEREKMKAIAEGSQVWGPDFEAYQDTGYKIFCKSGRDYNSHKLIRYGSCEYADSSESSRLLKRCEFLKAVFEKEGVEWLPKQECSKCGFINCVCEMVKPKETDVVKVLVQKCDCDPELRQVCDVCQGLKPERATCEHGVEKTRPTKCSQCFGKGLEELTGLIAEETPEPDYYTRAESAALEELVYALKEKVQALQDRDVEFHKALLGYLSGIATSAQRSAVKALQSRFFP